MPIVAADILALRGDPLGRAITDYLFEEDRSFREFIETLVLSLCTAHGISELQIRRNWQKKLRDDGVHLRIKVGVPDDPTGWMQVPTVWTYVTDMSRGNAAQALELKLTKPHSKRCIEEGYALRVAVCEELTADSRKSLEKRLNKACTDINKMSPPVHVLGARELAECSNRYLCMDMERWQKQVYGLVKKFIDVPDWKPALNTILKHVDLSKPVTEVILTLMGPTGTGKSRLVLEALREAKEVQPLVLYTRNQYEAVRIAEMLARNSEHRAILVTDQCSRFWRGKIQTWLNAHSDRVRVIAIEAADASTPSAGDLPHGPEVEVPPLADDVLESILELNFPRVSAARRASYTKLAKGSVLLAADLCVNASKFLPRGKTVPESVVEYLQKRLTEEEIVILEALSLVPRFEFKGPWKAGQSFFEKLTGMPSQKLEEVASTMVASNSFLDRAGWFFYVTPEVVAQAAFDLAWERWAKDDVYAFLDWVSKESNGLSYSRVESSSLPQVRHTYYLHWARSIKPEQLMQGQVIERLSSLITEDPESFIPVLKVLLEYIGNDRWQGFRKLTTGQKNLTDRNRLIKLGRSLSAYAKYFEDGEFILRKLALSEPEPTGATEAWQRLFLIEESGTPLAFSRRYWLLESLFTAESEAQIELACGGMIAILKAASGEVRPEIQKLDPPMTICASEPPMQWMRSQAERRAAIDLVMTQATKLAQQFELRNLASGLLSCSSLILKEGLLNQLTTLFGMVKDDKVVSATVVAAVRDYLHTAQRDGQSDNDYVGQVRAWLESIEPKDLHGQLMSLLGVSVTSEETHSEHMARIKSMADKVFKDNIALDGELRWLCSESAKHAWFFGNELGALDKDHRYLELFCLGSLKSLSANLAKGYIFGNVTSYPSNAQRINQQLDQLESQSPWLAHKLSVPTRRQTRGLERTLKMIDADQLPLQCLDVFIFGDDPLTEDEFKQVFERIKSQAKSGKVIASQLGLELIASRLTQEESGKNRTIFASDDVKADTIDFLMLPTTTESAILTSTHKLTRTLSKLANICPDQIAGVALQCLMASTQETPELENECIDVLVSIAAQRPNAVFAELESLLMSDDRSWHFRTGKREKLFLNLPGEPAIEWVKSKGQSLARRLAWHLPIPYADENGRAVVPKLTESVLTTYVQDEDLFSNFCAGTHLARTIDQDLSAQDHEIKQIAKLCLASPIQRIREWAEWRLDDSPADILSSADRTRRS